ncbi:hypothetical protein MPER_09781 [Moniliophthora perniciosa FA553]|nr:hypothetical protein MPER_09781 [Moniliophthora perniciosa FA553]
MPMLKSLQLEEKFDDEPPSDELQSFEKRTLTITRQFLGKLTIENHAKDSTLFLPKLTDIGLTLYDHGLAETALPTALLSRWILNDGGSLKESADCIKSIDIVFVGDNKEPVEILKEKLQSLRDTGVWMSLRVARVPKVVEEDDW